ncbi:MAG: BlaI/MecI/CopY family transcriptional regulator [Planctomycetota bacterium]|jgi:predicted transcriptional regulator
MAHKKKPQLSALEDAVMQVVWQRRSATAEQIRLRLAGHRPMKDSTVRTILRRLEKKGYVGHTTEGRTYVYSPKVAPQSVATDAVRGIIDRFCNGSVESLLVGMIDDELITPEKLQDLARRVVEAEAAEKHNRRSKGG